MKKDKKDCKEKREALVNKLCIFSCIYFFVAIFGGLIWTLIDFKISGTLGIGAWIMASGLIVRFAIMFLVPAATVTLACSCKVRDTYRKLTGKEKAGNTR